MKMPEPVGKFALMNGYRWTQVSAIEPSQPLYDKQALINLLEAAINECKRLEVAIDGGGNAYYRPADARQCVEAIRKLKDTL